MTLKNLHEMLDGMSVELAEKVHMLFMANYIDYSDYDFRDENLVESYCWCYRDLFELKTKASQEIVKHSPNAKWRVLQSAPVELSMKLEFAVFLFLLSYCIERDELAFSLYRRSFQVIYEATEKSQIGYCWSKISPYCPRPFLGLEWDKCEQLRKGFANRLYDEGRNIGTARNFTTEKRINKKLLKAAVKKFETIS